MGRNGTWSQAMLQADKATMLSMNHEALMRAEQVDDDLNLCCRTSHFQVTSNEVQSSKRGPELHEADRQAKDFLTA